MLTENDVIDAVCKYLEAHGHRIVSRCDTAQRGIDIVAARQGGLGRLLVEAKGETSADSKSARFGKAFNNAQVRDHVANAFYTGVCLHSENHRKGDAVALAFPETSLHRKYLEPIKPVLDSLGIAIYIVRRDGSVITS
jgi:hypothetical protein